jgi:hypothetical protein
MESPVEKFRNTDGVFIYISKYIAKYCRGRGERGRVEACGSI